MSQKVSMTCDQCGKVELFEDTSVVYKGGWSELTYPRASYLHHLCPDIFEQEATKTTEHFCAIKCLRSWLDGMDAVDTDPDGGKDVA